MPVIPPKSPFKTSGSSMPPGRGDEWNSPLAWLVRGGREVTEGRGRDGMEGREGREGREGKGKEVLSSPSIKAATPSPTAVIARITSESDRGCDGDDDSNR